MHREISNGLLRCSSAAAHAEVEAGSASCLYLLEISSAAPFVIDAHSQVVGCRLSKRTGRTAAPLEVKVTGTSFRLDPASFSLVDMAAPCFAVSTRA